MFIHLYVVQFFVNIIFLLYFHFGKWYFESSNTDNIHDHVDGPTSPDLPSSAAALLAQGAGKGESICYTFQINTSHCAPYFRNNWMIFQNKILNEKIFVFLCLACNVLYLNSVDTESLTGPQAVAKAIKQTFDGSQKPKQTVVHFKVSNQGITLTDNQRK